MMTLFCIGVVSATMTAFVVRLIPTWVLLVMAALAAVLLWRPLFKVRRAQSAIELQQPFQKPLEVAVAAALATWFAGPWALSLLYLEIVPTAQLWVIVICRWARGQ
jgi:hypothetical protein